MALFRYNPSDPNAAGQLEYPKIQKSRREADYTEVNSICDDLALDLGSNGEKYINSSDFFKCDPVQLFAISERLKLAEPTCGIDGPAFDFGHVLDFCQRLNNLKILGSNSRYGDSNILPNSLEFDLSVFKKIKSLWICDCNASLINDLRSCRLTVNNLTVHRSFSAISDINLEKDFPYENESLSFMSNPTLLWPNIKSVDFSFNRISSIDRSVIFFRPVVTLNLTGNKLTDIDHLQHLTHLSELNLSHNSIEQIVDWHQKLGNLKRLVLVANKLKSIEGLRKLYSLEYLDLRNNQLVQTVDVRSIGNLPCLKNLYLTGNPLEASVEYRSRILEWFADRAAEIVLDDQITSSRELDTVGVRVAIRKAKEDKEKQLRLAKERIDHALNMVVDPPYFTDSSSSFEKDASP